ncbi:MAG TPA: protein phosphatase CheZ [Steroidobacteraceae bacterium]|nr:protein phosphatase CheZ [Steroidobacteraceae bacterium]
MSNFQVLQLEYGACVDALSEALRSADETAFFTAVDHIVRMREPQTLTEIRRLTGDLQNALERFSIESRLADFAENEIPDAKTRLAHVIKMTDEAAHRTLDLVEQSGPLAERSAREAGALIDSLKTYRERPSAGGGFEGAVRAIDAFLPLVRALEAFLPAVRTDSEQIRRNLADVLLAQGYQDLTGQIIRSVMKLVDELEETLASLTKLSGDVVEHTTLGENPDKGHGPVVPGVTRGDIAAGQTDVDELLSGLGM